MLDIKDQISIIVADPNIFLRDISFSNFRLILFSFNLLVYGDSQRSNILDLIRRRSYKDLTSEDETPEQIFEDALYLPPTSMKSITNHYTCHLKV